LIKGNGSVVGSKAKYKSGEEESTGVGLTILEGSAWLRENNIIHQAWVKKSRIKSGTDEGWKVPIAHGVHPSTILWRVS
jgi:hypothetical protein